MDLDGGRDDVLHEKRLREERHDRGEEVQIRIHQLLLAIIAMGERYRIAVLRHHGPKQRKDQSLRHTAPIIHIVLRKCAHDRTENGTQLNLNGLHRIVRNLFQQRKNVLLDIVHTIFPNGVIHQADMHQTSHNTPPVHSVPLCIDCCSRVRLNPFEFAQRQIHGELVHQITVKVYDLRLQEKEHHPH